MTAGCRPAGVLPLLATLLTLAAVLGASPAVAAVIRDADVDVAALQDVDRHWSARSDFADQAAELAQTLGMHYVYGANLDRDPLESGQPRRRYGNAPPRCSCWSTSSPTRRPPTRHWTKLCEPTGRC
jgi:hypothetical protein